MVSPVGGCKESLLTALFALVVSIGSGVVLWPGPWSSQLGQGGSRVITVVGHPSAESLAWGHRVPRVQLLVVSLKRLPPL